MRKTLVLILGLVFGWFGLLNMAATANATEVECQTVTTTLTDRPDSGHGGTWATDDLTRTVEICEHPHQKDGYSLYKATLTDTGSFETLDVDHTPAGTPHDLPAGHVGEVNGTANFEIKAGSDWIGFDPSAVDGQEFVGDAGPSTGEWVLGMFGPHAKEHTEVFGNSWSWTYTTCAEQWVNQAEAVGPETGDITGLKCAVATDPSTSDQECPDTPGFITLADDPGVKWTINGESHEPGTYPFPVGSHNVAAATEDGYVFDPAKYDEDPVWNPQIFGPETPCPGPEGPKGDTGDQGPKGEQGDTPDQVDTDETDDTITPVASSTSTLPKTGSTLTTAGFGVALLILGGAAVFLARRTGGTARR